MPVAESRGATFPQGKLYISSGDQNRILIRWEFHQVVKKTTGNDTNRVSKPGTAKPGLNAKYGQN